MDLTQLNNLSEAEKKIALQILKQMQEDGHSKIFEDLIYDDYAEVPVDIETFLLDDRYLGNAWKDSRGNPKIYPFWLDTLKKIFPTNIDTDYNTILETGARGLGKSEIACGAIGAYLMYRILCLKDPRDFYHLKTNENIVFAFMNIKLELAEEIAVDKFQKTVQLSPWFMQRGTMTSRKNQPYWVPKDPIKIIIGSQSDDVIGQPIYFAFFDEISFIKNQDIDKQKTKAKDMIDTALGGMLTRFIHNGKNPTVLAVASSKRSEQSFMESYIKTITETEGTNAIVIDKPVWEVKPEGTYGKGIFYVGLGNRYMSSIVIPDEDSDKIEAYREKGYKILEVPRFFRSKFLEDIDRNLCDIAGISSSSLNKYMSSEAVLNTVDRNFLNPFPDVIEVGNSPTDYAEYSNFFDMERVPKQFMSKPLYVHLDMSLSGDMTGIAGTWIIGKKTTVGDNPSKDLTFQLAFSTSVKAPKGYQISFEKNRNFIRWLKSVGFKIKTITSDTYQAYDLQQQLKAEGFNCDILSVDRVDKDGICKPYQHLKAAVYEKRFVMYKSDRLFTEFVDIERNANTGKIDHPDGGHKDVLDAVCASCFEASKHAEEFAYDYGESYDNMNSAVSVNIESNDAQQLTINFEEELAKMFNPLQNEMNSLNNQQPFNSYLYLQDGIIV